MDLLLVLIPIALFSYTVSLTTDGHISQFMYIVNYIDVHELMYIKKGQFLLSRVSYTALGTH